MATKLGERLRWEREWRTQRVRDRWIMAPRWAQLVISAAVWLAGFVAFTVVDDSITGRWRAAWYVVAVLIIVWIGVGMVRDRRR
jgi:hypothetical protein